MAKQDSTARSDAPPHVRDSLISAVCHLRRSSDQQEQSLPDQKREVTKYAEANGYQLLHWYQDDAISGDDTLRRHGFLDMHAVACGNRDFNAILVWDIDRFGRFHSMEAGYWVHPLMKAGVRLVSVTEGPVNWDDFTGRVVYSLKQEGKYHRVVAGDVRARDGFAQAKVKVNAESKQIRIPNAHPALIEQETWEKVQEKLVARKGRTTPWRQENGDLYLLSGLVHCGHCQMKMYGKSKRKVRGGKPYRRAELERQAHPVDDDAEAESVLNQLWSLEQEIQEAEPARLCELIRRIVGRVDLYFDHIPRGKRIKCSLSRGMIELGQDPIFFGLVNRDGAR